MATETKKELINKYEIIVERYNLGTIDLNIWEEGFIDNIGEALEAEDGFLTDLQITKLEEIYEKYCE